MKKMLIAIDDGTQSEIVELKGFQLGQQINEETTLISVVDTTTLITDGAVSTREIADITHNDLQKNQQKLMDKVFKDIKVLSFVEEGTPFEEILRVAGEWEADLIVLGTHGRTGLSHLLMGSVAEKVFRHSIKPLFIIPTK